MLDKTGDPNLAVYVVWVPKNGARAGHVDRVTALVTDRRATQYWDGYQAVMAPYHRRYELTGPCAGIFMVFDREAKWDGTNPPEPTWAEDAHARDFDRALPHWDARRFAQKVQELLR